MKVKNERSNADSSIEHGDSTDLSVAKHALGPLASQNASNPTKIAHLKEVRKNGAFYPS
ncbi:hypothetical protein LC085_10970 [Bacillus tianshenii]|uniref:hypothetical protein n=1 Tax=Sutcliffiella tianshenii TaxID=1463404 RepID=UPI001CD3BEE8|nr:hypothetical protein [Bacillus tianshenii]MCA1320431.1 hypothetical protein [Bacillus tianshenii]